MAVQIFPTTGVVSSGLNIYDELVLLGKSNIINFQGNSVNVTASAIPGTVDVSSDIEVTYPNFPDLTTFLTPYDSLVLSKSPLIYLTPDAQFDSLNTVTPNLGGVTLNRSSAGSTPLVQGAQTSWNFNTNRSLAKDFSVQSFPDLNLHQNKTVEYWMRFTAKIGTPYSALHRSGDGSSWIQFESGWNGGFTTADRLYVARWNGGWSVALSPTPLINNTIYHCVISWDTSRAYLYLNGVLTNPGGTAWTTFSMNPTIGYVYRLGRPHNNATTAYCQEDVSNIAIYNRVLTDAEILEHYNTGRL